MGHDDDKGTLLTRLQTAADAARRQVRQAGGGLIDRARGMFDERVTRLVRDRADELAHALEDPKNVEHLQESLARISQFGIEMGFRADPNAELLFRFVDWVEQRHGRPTVARLVFEHGVILQEKFLSFALHHTGMGSMIGLPEAAPVDAAEVHHVRDVARQKLITLLSELAALESDEPPPSGQTARVDYFQAAPIPDEYKLLIRLAAGDAEAFRQAQARREPSATASTDRNKPTSEKLLNTLKDRLGGARERALTRFVPSFEDPELRFLVLSNLFFMQTYLVRLLIEDLPELLDVARQTDSSSPEPGPDGVVDVD